MSDVRKAIRESAPAPCGVCDFGVPGACTCAPTSQDALDEAYQRGYAQALRDAVAMSPAEKVRDAPEQTDE